MRIVCAKNILAENISVVSKAIGSKTTMPILECCLLTASGGFRLMANDMEMAIETKEIEADILEEGSVALDSRVFFDIVRRLPGSNVEIYSDSKNLTVIKSGKSEFKIMGMNPDEFPALPTVETDKCCKIPSVELKNMIRQTIFSVSQDTSKPILCGELLEIEENCIKMVSADGFRISMRKYDFDNDGISAKVVIPGKSLSEISKILPTDSDSITTLYITDKHILFDLENSTVVSRLLEGEYINYKMMFSKEAETFVNIEKSVLLESIERATLISRDSKKSPVKLKLDDGQIIITSNTEMGASYEEVSAEQDGPGLEIGFNPRYLTEVLKVLEVSRVILGFTTPLSPCVIKTEGSDDHGYLIAPLRLRN